MTAEHTDHFNRQSCNYNVIGDWGTSRLRLFRVEGGHIVDRRDGVGIGAIDGNAEAAFADAIGPWLADGMPQSIELCGMVGARDGWVEAPYATCPADAESWRTGAIRFDWRGVPVSVMAGLTCVAEDGIPDVMRGEEAQIFGAFAVDPGLAQGRRLIVLPGTHNKWVLVEEGRVIAFRSMPTGELFALLRTQSTLGPKDATGDAGQEALGFAEGLARANEGGLIGSMFAARSMRLRAGRSADWALGYLSGLLIGSEVGEALRLFAVEGSVTLIGDARLSARYAQALEARGVPARLMDGDACALAGLGFVERTTA